MRGNQLEPLMRRKRVSVVSVLLACIFLIAARQAFAEMFVSDRAMEDMKEAEAAKKAEPRGGAGRAGSGTFKDANGYTWKYGYSKPAKIEPGMKYPIFVGNTGWAMAANSSQEKYPCYTMAVYAPPEIITPTGNGSQRVPEHKSQIAAAYKVAIDKVLAENPSADASRVWVEGSSMAGAIALLAAYHYPDTFAAVMPPVGGGDLCKAIEIGKRKIGVWVFYGVNDGGEVDFVKKPYGRTGPYIHKALTDAGYACNYTKYTQGTHYEFGFTDSLTNPEWNDFTRLREWLWEQKKPMMDWPVINSPTILGATVGQPFTYTITANNSPKSFAAARTIEHAETKTGKIMKPERDLPQGLSLDAKTGIISGTPTEAGQFFIRMTATNDKGSGISTLFLTVKDK